MLHLVCALKCEARHLIRYFELEKTRHGSLFSCYANPEAGLTLTVSGVGKINAAAAVLHTHTCFDTQPYDGWFNVGIGGHLSAPVGSIYLAHKVTDNSTGKSWYPQLAFKSQLETRNIVTLDKPSTDYFEDIIDMEGSGFCELAGRLATFELIHCCKIISDNRENPVQYPPAGLVEKLVSTHLGAIESVIQQLHALSGELARQFPVHTGFQECMQKWHFSRTQQNILKKLLANWQVIFPHEDVFEMIGTADSSREVIAILKQVIDHTPIAVQDL